MHVVTKYDIELSDFEVIPANTRLEIDPSWNEYTGFIAVKYRGGSLYFNINYFEEMPSLVEVI